MGNTAQQSLFRRNILMNHSPGRTAEESENTRLRSFLKPVLCFLLLFVDCAETIRPDQISLPIWPPPLKNPQKPQCRWQMAPSSFQIFYCPWPVVKYHNSCWVIIYRQMACCHGRLEPLTKWEELQRREKVRKEKNHNYLAFNYSF